MTSTHYHPVVVTADSETAVSSFLEKNMGFIEAEMNRLDYLNEDNLTRELGEKEGKGGKGGKGKGQDRSKEAKEKNKTAREKRQKEKKDKKEQRDKNRNKNTS